MNEPFDVELVDPSELEWVYAADGQIAEVRNRVTGELWTREIADRWGPYGHDYWGPTGPPVLRAHLELRDA